MRMNDLRVKPLDEAALEINDNVYSPPAFTLEVEDAQILMNSLWDCGLRPIGGKGSAGQLVAVQEHLKDMRIIAFNKLNIKEN